MSHKKERKIWLYSLILTNFVNDRILGLDQVHFLVIYQQKKNEKIEYPAIKNLVEMFKNGADKNIQKYNLTVCSDLKQHTMAPNFDSSSSRNLITARMNDSKSIISNGSYSSTDTSIMLEDSKLFSFLEETHFYVAPNL